MRPGKHFSLFFGVYESKIKNIFVNEVIERANDRQREEGWASFALSITSLMKMLKSTPALFNTFVNEVIERAKEF